MRRTAHQRWSGLDDNVALSPKLDLKQRLNFPQEKYHIHKTVALHIVESFQILKTWT